MGHTLMDPFLQHPTNITQDPLWQGDDISNGKDDHHLRMMFHNVNGLSSKGVDGLDMFVNDQADLQIDIQGFSEHCLDTAKFSVFQGARDTISRHYQGQTILQMDSSGEEALHIYKPGGTGLLVLGDVVGRQETQGRGGDPLGRWSYIHLRRKFKPPVTIISAYQVCPRPTNIMGNTAYHQQRRALNAMGESSLHPRQAFIRDLSSFLKILRTKGHDIILGGDFNEALTDKQSGILRLINTHNMLDPFLTRFPHHDTFCTHSMGQKRIGYVFITPDILPSLKKIGYAPFYYSKPSDHRPVLLEFDKFMLFGQRTEPLQTACDWNVKSKDRKTVKAFIHAWYNEIFNRKGFHFRPQLEQDSVPPNVAEMVDDIIGLSGDLAEQTCKRRRPEYYSQHLVQQRIKVSILRGHLNSLRMGKNRSEPLNRRMQRAGMQFPLPLTQRLTSIALKQAKEELRNTCMQSAEARQAELSAKIDAAAQSGTKSKARILRAIKKVENNHRTFTILRQMRQRRTESQRIDRLEIPASWPSTDSPLTNLETLEDPKECTQWKWVKDPHEVEHYLLLRNRLHFGQAQGTPFTCPPFDDDLDWSASTEVADQILNGSYSYSSHIPNCNDLIRACQTSTTGDDLPAEISKADFRGKIKAWRESTTTSPSGRHLGRYKALFVSGISEEDTEELREDIPVEKKQEAIAALILTLMNYCIRNKYVLERWKKIINVMIFKEQGNFKIHRLRVIHIYEADFNLILAVKWRQLLRHADNHQMINGGQYGGRPGCEAQSLTLLEELKYDISYLTRRTLVHFDNDATSCYDRIIVPFASLINRKYGIHPSVVAVHASTLQNARFHLKTASGVSDRYYSPCKQFPIHGTGQGSGNSPSIWLFISSTLFDVHSSLAHGVRFVSPDGQLQVKFSMVGFVDDSTGNCNDFQPQTETNINALLRMMTSDAQIWSNLLYCSGGKLELPKCSFHVMRFTFRPNGQPSPAIDQYENRIKIQDLENKEWVNIPSKRPFAPHLTLGHYKSPTSTGIRALCTLQTKADRIALLICTSPLTRSGAFLAYQSIYIPSVQYTLPQSFFSRQELEKAQAPSVHKILSKCGYNRNTARALIYAPIRYAGGGFLPWYVLQGEGQIKHFIKHWRTNTIISRTLRIAVLWAQWQTGLDRSLLDDTTSPIPHLECRWIKSLRAFLRDIQGRFIVDLQLAPIPERKFDIYIMRYAMECGEFNDEDLRIINYCRLYLHVTTVSELFNAAGTRIIPELFKCRREPWFDTQTYITLQARPRDYQKKKQSLFYPTGGVASNPARANYIERVRGIHSHWDLLPGLGSGVCTG